MEPYFNDDDEFNTDQLEDIFPKLFTNVDVVKPPEYYLSEDDENFKDIRIIVDIENLSIHFNIEYQQLLDLLEDADVCSEMNDINGFSIEFLQDVLEAAEEKLVLYEYFEFINF